jgi:hypothetical protein
VAASSGAPFVGVLRKLPHPLSLYDKGRAFSTPFVTLVFECAVNFLQKCFQFMAEHDMIYRVRFGLAKFTRQQE